MFLFLQIFEEGRHDDGENWLVSVDYDNWRHGIESANMKGEMKAAGQQWMHVGVVSFGSSAGCESGYPGCFTRTESYLDWISSETGMEL